jgi:apolipoprotein N-acyltransferase
MITAGRLRLVGLLVSTPVLAWLALPGRFSFWPLLFICLVPLLIVLSRLRTIRGSFFFGLGCGIPFYVLQIYWIVPVLVEFGGLPWLVAALAMLLLILYMSFYLGLFGAGLALLKKGGGFWPFFIGGPALWVGLDWVRSWLFSGFPWMDLGYGLWDIPRLLQGADLFGHHGYTFVIVMVNIVISLFLSRSFGLIQRYGGALVAILLLGALTTYSLVRWGEVEERVRLAPAPLIGIVQGNIAQGQKWAEQSRESTVTRYLELSGELAEDRALELIVWPETAVPFYPETNPLSQSIEIFARDNKPLLTGAPWYQIDQTEAGDRQIRFFNAAVVMTSAGWASERYFKSHLVPFGEYVPLRRYLPFISPLVEAAGNFTPGEVARPLTIGTIRAGVLICFESIFPQIARSWVESGANVLVNLTNDAWYGKSSAPYQSWAMTVFRSLETRRSLVRSANTGISGVIDPLGRIRAESDIFVVWSQAVKTPLFEERTIFVRWGFWFGPACALLGVLFCSIALLGSRRKGGLVL